MNGLAFVRLLAADKDGFAIDDAWVRVFHGYSYIFQWLFIILYLVLERREV